MTIDGEHPFLDQLMALYRAGDRTATAASPGTLLVQLVQQVYRQIIHQDYAAAGEMMTDDFEMEILGPPDIPFTGSWSGREQAIATLQRNFAMVENQRPELLGVSAYRDAVLVMARETGVVTATRQPYDVHWVQWFTFRGERLCRVLEIFDRDELGAVFQPPA
jgi:ketosteroid isomerase-like protein